VCKDWPASAIDARAGLLLYLKWMTTGFLELPGPRLPPRSAGRGIAVLAIAASVHVLIASIVVIGYRAAPGDSTPATRQVPVPAIAEKLPQRLIFLPNRSQGGGGGGGGNRQSAPIRRAEGIGHNAITLRTTRRPVLSGIGPTEPETPALVLDAMPLASGAFNHLGLPEGGVSYGYSTGPGSGGGVGTGAGTGLGSGRGAGVGPGSGGGFGGGAYRPGAGVTAPRLILQVKPAYTPDALERKIQGSVWLEIVVTREGRVSDVRVTQSLDATGLDEEAIVAVRQWRFEPGRLAGAPVDVLVTVAMDFTIR
jgi:TonB family protein